MTDSGSSGPEPTRPETVIHAIPLQAVPSQPSAAQAMPPQAVPPQAAVAVPQAAAPSQAAAAVPPQAAAPPQAAVPPQAVPSQAALFRERRRPAYDDDDGEMPLLADADELHELRAGWQKIKAGFVDDPRGSVTEAANVVAEATTMLLAALRARQTRIRDSWDDDDADVDTESLRQALLTYQAFFNRIARQ